MKLKAKCKPSTVRKKRENLSAKTQVSEIFQITFHFKARTEESTILVRIKKKLMTDIQKDKLALISDRPFLMCVFYVPSIK